MQPGLQKLTEEKLSAHLERFGARRGAVVAMDPATGVLLARAGFRRDDATRKLIADDEAAFTLGFPGASTLKTLVVAGALEAGAVAPSDVFDTGNGTLTLDGKTYSEWKDGGVGEGLPRRRHRQVVQPRRDPDRTAPRRRAPRGLPGTARLFRDSGRAGGGPRLGERRRGLRTTRQMAHAYSAVVNGGRLPGGEETLVRADVSDFIRKTLVKAVEEGTGADARLKSVVAGGKTGTSIREVGGARTGTAYLVGFAPADAPRVGVSVVVDDLGKDANGSRHAASLSREIVESGLPLLTPRDGSPRLSSRGAARRGAA